MNRNTPAPDAHRPGIAVSTKPAAVGKRGGFPAGRECKTYLGGTNMRANLRPLNCKVSPMTLKNLSKLAKIAGYDDNCLGKVIDKLVRDQMVELREEREWQR